MNGTFGKTLPVSCMLLAESLIRLVLSENYKTAQWKEIVVVTGQGHGSGDIGPVLQQQVPQFLSDHNGPEIITPVKNNLGRFLIKKSSLKKWSRSKNFTRFQIRSMWEREVTFHRSNSSCSFL